MSIQAGLLIVRQAHANRLRWGEDDRDRNLYALRRLQEHADHVGHMKPWLMNRAGACCECGEPLDFYDTKMLERGGALRVMCNGHVAHDRRLWWLWTDG